VNVHAHSHKDSLSAPSYETLPATTITVRQALALPAVQRAMPEVLAGQGGLDRQIRWVHAGEVPNIASLLKGEELLLTTGMGIGRDRPAQRRFVAELAERGVAALAIELGSSVSEVPPALVEAAAEHDLPLIAFHREVRFVEITEAVHREIVDRGGELLRRGEALHRRFTELLLRGATVPDVLTELSRFVANPVVLERAGQGVAYHARHRADDATVLAAWATFSRGDAAAPAAIAERVPMGEDESWGRLIVLAVDSELGEQDRIAVERAVGLIALALMRDREEEGLAFRERGDFLGALPGTQASEGAVSARARELGFGPGGQALLPIAAMRAPGIGEREQWALARRDVQAELEAQKLSLLAGVGGEGEDLLLMVGLPAIGERGRIADLVAETITAACERRLGDPDAVVVCVGPPAQSWLEAGAGIAATVESLSPAAAGDPRPWHDVAAADTDRLLWLLREQPALRRFAELRLRPLLDRDAGGRSQLLPTLATYCQHGGRKAETARALHIERQSLYHRLARIEETLGVDLSDGDTLLALHLALRANRYLELK
jgi:purine catabolism regulator